MAAFKPHLAALADLTRSLAKPGNPGNELGEVARLASVLCAVWLRADEALDAELAQGSGRAAAVHSLLEGLQAWIAFRRQTKRVLTARRDDRDRAHAF